MALSGTGLAWSGIKLASGAIAAQRRACTVLHRPAATRGASDAASRNVWLSGYGLDGDLDGDASSGPYDYRISGLIIGIDTEIDRHWTAGLSAAYSDWRVRNDGRGDRSDVKAYRIGALRSLQRRAGPRRRHRRLRQRRLRDRSPHRVRHDQPHGPRRLQRRSVHRHSGRTLPHRARALRHRAVRGASVRARIAGRLRRGRRGLNQSGRRGPDAQINPRHARCARRSRFRYSRRQRTGRNSSRLQPRVFGCAQHQRKLSSAIRREPAWGSSPRTSIATAGWPARACHSHRRRTSRFTSTSTATFRVKARWYR